MKCSVVQRHMSSYLDGAVTRSQLAQISEHIAGCDDCSAEYENLRQMQKMVGSLGRKPAPPEVAMRARVAISRELANARHPRWASFAVRWQNAFNAIMVPATAGLVTTIIIFGLLMSFLYYPGQLAIADDVPTAFYTPPELQFAPFELAAGFSNSDDLVVEAYVDANGRVQDYRILWSRQYEVASRGPEERADLHDLPSCYELRPSHFGTSYPVVFEDSGKGIAAASHGLVSVSCCRSVSRQLHIPRLRSG